MRRLTVTAVVVACAAGAGFSHAAVLPGPAGEEAGLHLILNVAGGRLDVYENGKRTHTYRVSVGMRGYETPAGEYNIREVIWNPWWHPPNSDWARGRKPEAPGPKNPMGRVKLNFAPLLYIHGTPEYEALGAPASRGCVRMRNEDVIELTRLVHRHATPRLDRSLLDRLIGSPTQTRTIRLQQAVRFTANYRVATVDDGFLIIYPDVYRLIGDELRDQVEIVLEENGVDLRSVNREHLDRLIEKGGTRRVAMSLDTLVSALPAQGGGR